MFCLLGWQGSESLRTFCTDKDMSKKLYLHMLVNAQTDITSMKGNSTRVIKSNTF